MTTTGGPAVSGIRTVEGGLVFLTFTKVGSYVSTCGRILLIPACLESETFCKKFRAVSVAQCNAN
jgi:hypothetical protein